ncbi:unnamed protein product [Linum tenue]|uniref:Uncharacterized protein n=1 Tax=Linum tenue TaxID=586396 RepID=A0AAV0ICB6_9ROSI|nr:unnamed protein product [Linum tenue]
MFGQKVRNQTSWWQCNFIAFLIKTGKQSKKGTEAGTEGKQSPSPSET